MKNRWVKIKNNSGFPSTTCNVVVRTKAGAEIKCRFLAPMCRFSTFENIIENVVEWRYQSDVD